MAFGVHARLVDPRVQGGVVNVLDLLTWGHTMIQFDSIGTTSTESVTWVEKVDEFKAIHERLEVRRGFFEAFPVTPPHFDDVVPSVFKIFDFLLGCVVHILHGPITVTYMFFVTVGITAGTPVDETTLEFVHRVRVLAVPIHEEEVLGKAERGIWKKLRESMKRMRSCLTSKSLHPFRSCSTIRLSLWY